MSEMQMPAFVEAVIRLAHAQVTKLDSASLSPSQSRAVVPFTPSSAYHSPSRPSFPFSLPLALSLRQPTHPLSLSFPLIWLFPSRTFTYAHR